MVAREAKASTTDPDDVDDDERMVNAMPAAAIKGAIFVMVGRDGDDVTRRPGSIEERVDSDFDGCLEGEG